MWHALLEDDQMLIFDEIKSIFSNLFEIKSIYYDRSKFYFYKVIMLPYKTGYILKNKFCSFDINVIDFENSAKNEVQCIYLINTNNYTNKMDIRIGNLLILYVVDMQFG